MQQSIGRAEAAGDRPALARVHNILGILANSEVLLEHAREHLERSLGLSEPLDEPAARVAALNILALVYGRLGQHMEAVARLEQALALGTAFVDRYREAAPHRKLADLLHASGQAEAASTCGGRWPLTPRSAR